MANIYDIILNLIDRNQVDGIENRICKINFDIPVCDINVTNNFFYISFLGNSLNSRIDKNSMHKNTVKSWSRK